MSIAHAFAKLPLCHGSGDCLEEPTRRCASDQHNVCELHVSMCYLCQEEMIVGELSISTPVVPTNHLTEDS